MALEIITEARLEHLPAILQIEQECFGVDAFNRRQMRYLIQSQNPFLIAMAEERIAGYMILLKRKKVTVLRLYAIAIHPGFRGKGLASSLVEKAIQIASKSGFSKISLEVRTDNQAAVSLYRQKGFEVAKRLSQYYKDGKDALRMVLNVKDHSNLNV